MTAAGAGTDSRSAAMRGIGWMVLSGIGYSINAGLVKQLSSDLNTMEIVFWRSVVATVILLPFLCKHIGATGRESLKNWHLFLLRGFFTYLAMGATYYALANMPIADVYALQFTLPLFMILAAILFLGEKARVGSWVVIFAGAYDVLRRETRGAKKG
jgi:drug/metabolite transporter (DMT)-like permease